MLHFPSDKSRHAGFIRLDLATRRCVMLAQYYRHLIERRGAATCLMHNFFHMLVFSLCVFFIIYLLQAIIDTNLSKIYIYISLFTSIGLGIIFVGSCAYTIKSFSLFYLSIIYWMISILIPFSIGILLTILPGIVEYDLYYYASGAYDVAIILVPALSVLYPIIIFAALYEIHRK